MASEGNGIGKVFSVLGSFLGEVSGLKRAIVKNPHRKGGER